MKKSLKVLVVDGDQRVREAVADALEAFGHEAAEAEDAVEALAVLATEDFDLVVTDWRMPPGMDGMELANQIRTRLGLSRLPIILMTGDELSPVQKQVAHEAGITGFLKKPVGLPQLKAAIEAIVGPKPEEPGTPLRPDPALRSMRIL